MALVFSTKDLSNGLGVPVSTVRTPFPEFAEDSGKGEEPHTLVCQRRSDLLCHNGCHCGPPALLQERAKRVGRAASHALRSSDTRDTSIEGAIYLLNRHTVEQVTPRVPGQFGEEFVAFLVDVVASQPRGKEIHIIADNLSAHKTRRVRQFLDTHTHVNLHFTPTYSSWLNQVELWFSKIERDVITPGVFTSVRDLARKLMRYIRRYNLDPKPIKWTYRDPSHRIRGFDSSVTVH